MTLFSQQNHDTHLFQWSFVAIIFDSIDPEGLTDPAVTTVDPQIHGQQFNSRIPLFVYVAAMTNDGIRQEHQGRHLTAFLARLHFCPVDTLQAGDLGCPENLIDLFFSIRDAIPFDFLLPNCF